jgi:hypothetical protein
MLLLLNSCLLATWWITNDLICITTNIFPDCLAVYWQGLVPFDWADFVAMSIHMELDLVEDTK